MSSLVAFCRRCPSLRVMCCTLADGVGWVARYANSLEGSMMFKCDPVLEPGGRGLVALRTVAGEAFCWVPGGDVDEFVGFVGSEFQAVGGQVYRRVADGVLVPFDVNVPLVVVKPPAGDMHFLSPDEFKQRWAILEVDVPEAVVPETPFGWNNDAPETVQQDDPEPVDAIAVVEPVKWMTGSVNVSKELAAEWGLTAKNADQAGTAPINSKTAVPDPDSPRNPPASSRKPGRPKKQS